MLSSSPAPYLPDEEYARFPRLYHLDDYETCLSQPDGLYCLGSFHIAPLKQPHAVFDMLKVSQQRKVGAEGPQATVMHHRYIYNKHKMFLGIL